MHIHLLINNKINNTMHSISATYIKPFIKPLANLICVTLLFVSPVRHCERSEAIQALLEKSKKQACNPHGYWSAGRLLFNLNAKKQRVMITNGEWRHED